MAEESYVNVNDSSYTVVVMSRFEYDGENYVVYKSRSGMRSVKTEKAFSDSYTSAPKYVDGRLYQSADRKDVFMFQAGDGIYQEGRFIRFGSSSKFQHLNKTGENTVSNYERDYGPLSELWWADRNFDVKNP